MEEPSLTLAGPGLGDVTVFKWESPENVNDLIIFYHSGTFSGILQPSRF